MRSSNADDTLEVDRLRAHTLAINVGRAYRLEGRIDGHSIDAQMHNGSMKLVEAGPRSIWHWDSGQPIDMLHLSIDDDALRASASELGLSAAPQILTRAGFIDPELDRLSKAFVSELSDSSTNSLVADSLRVTLILSLLQNYSSYAGRDCIRIPPNRLSPRTLRLIQNYVDTNLGMDLGIIELAQLAGLSRFHFGRVFRDTVGTTPYRYVLYRRLQRARDLIRLNRASLSEIANLTGFVDQSHLTRQVKRRYGATPGALRAS